jgi:hypothetical protein
MASSTLNGKRGLRVTEKVQAQTSQQPQAQRTTGEALVVIEGLEFANGLIEAEIAGAPAPEAPETARGFVGIGQAKGAVALTPGPHSIAHFRKLTITPAPDGDTR